MLSETDRHLEIVGFSIATQLTTPWSFSLRVKPNSHYLQAVGVAISLQFDAITAVHLSFSSK